MGILTKELSDQAGQWVIKETVISLPGTGAAVQLVAYNALRWGLIIGQTSVAAITWRLSTTPNPGATIGIVMPNVAAALPFAMTYDEFGGAVQSQWYAAATAGGGGQVTVIEILAQQ